jgi:hypothetical protein
MENKIDIFENYKLEELKPFENPLENIFFLYYLDHNNVYYDHDKLYNDKTYLQSLYDDYFNHLICELNIYRPNFPPLIDVKEFVNENKIKDLSKMNGGNSFIIYRKYLIKHLETIRINISMQLLASLATILWKSEPENVKSYYKDLWKEIKNLHDERVKSIIHDKRKQSSVCEDNEKLSSKKIRNITKKNGGNSFIIFRQEFSEYLKQLGYNLTMQEISHLACFYWSRQPETVKNSYKEKAEQTKKVLNSQLKKIVL